MQIHHIDENPANNDKINLAVMCLEDHEKTQVSGGFGRKLGRLEVIEYRNDWVRRVAERRSSADLLSSERMSSDIKDHHFSFIAAEDLAFIPPPVLEVAALLDALPDIRAAAYQSARRLWDTGITSEMNVGNEILIDVCESLLVQLAKFYPARHFGEIEAEVYFNKIVANSYEWAFSLYEVKAEGHPGTMISTIIGGCVFNDLERKIEEMVEALWVRFVFPEADFDMERWRSEWKAASDM